MPFNLRETIGGINHLRLRWEKNLLSRPADYFFKQIQEAQSTKTLVKVASPQNGQSVCVICGYSMALFEITGGWTLETCSATGIRPLLKSAAFKKWLSALPEASATKRAAERSPADLPSSGS